MQTAASLATNFGATAHDTPAKVRLMTLWPWRWLERRLISPTIGWVGFVGELQTPFACFAPLLVDGDGPLDAVVLVQGESM